MRREIHTAIGAMLAACALAGCFTRKPAVPRAAVASTTPAPRPLPAPVQAPARVPPPVQVPVIDAPASAPELPAPAVAAPVAVAEPVIAVPLPGAPAAFAPAPRIEPLPLASVVRFGSDAFLPEPGSDALLRAHAEQLKADPRRRLLLKGHGDARGTIHYNQALAAKRADTVARALRAYGVDASQLTLIAIGDDSNPDGPDVRRVVLIYR
jgi:outer membrane protein OmpA-like peptidoglycan-associated protein